MTALSSKSKQLEDRDWVLDDHNWSHKAWMSVADADLFEAILLCKAVANKPLEILEWGSGRSTLYFSMLLASTGIAFRWLSLEYNRDFFSKEVEPQLDSLNQSKVSFCENAVQSVPVTADNPEHEQMVEFVVFNQGQLLPMLRDHKEDRQVNLDAYVHYPERTGRRFDLILVDGRKRRRCLTEAARLLAPGGIAVLHDAWRPYYHCAFDNYQNSRSIGDILWVGMQESKETFNQILEDIL